ncbi:choice-of-anchor tandem repeat GloVer-containing protein [Fulvivirga ligni]|uniref:choice-of-anchor tandem repeat GloVer-containing protein n=1 Tax=Fulvivirga ligni TaxID=2904246 RepID=UPI001F210334|nr:choice-of-anchor tandem repeat GloVer-containing protein [Fulvivirga ligni]UII20616.1 T9SS type A sorting domain-containing protein [Fulvivirga ligni]
MKKFCWLFLLMASFLTHRAIAQEKIWGVQYGSLFHMNEDGSDYTVVLSNLVGRNEKTIAGNDGLIYGILNTRYADVLYRYDPSSKQSKRIISTADFRVYDFLQDYDGSFYAMGTAWSGQSLIVKFTSTDVETVFSSEEIDLKTITDGKDGKFYCTAVSEEASVVLSINKDGSDVQTLHTFNQTLEGQDPTLKLAILEDGRLLGATSSGGAYNLGTLYRMEKDGSEFVVTHHFRVESIHEDLTKSLFIASDGSIYGSIQSDDDKVGIFRTNADGSGMRIIKEPTFASKTQSNLVEKDGYIYSLNFNDQATFFRYSMSTDQNETIANDLDSIRLQDKIFVIGNSVYGSFTKTPDALERGLFSISLDDIFTSEESDFFNIERFYNSEPVGNNVMRLIKGSDNVVYGVTREGGIGFEDFGAIFKITNDQPELIRLQEYAQSISINIAHADDGYIYAATLNVGGPNAMLYKIKTDGTGYEDNTLSPYHFKSVGGILQTSSGEIIAMTEGHDRSESRGYMFKFKNGISWTETTYKFTTADGKVPLGALIEGDDGYLYSTTNIGGANNKGVIFKVLPDGTNYQKLHEFNGNDGQLPTAGLADGGDGFLYGSTPEGGMYGEGVIFKIRNDGSDFSIIYHFDGSPYSEPYHELTLVGDYLFGSVKGGDSGAVAYKIKKDGSDFSVVLSGGTPTIYFTRMPSPEVTSQVTLPSDSSTYILEGSELSVMVKSVFGASEYYLEISESETFEDIVWSGTSSTTSFSINGLSTNTPYYTRVSTDISSFGDITTFTLANQYVTRLWGVTTSGGDNPCFSNLGGTVFSISPDGTGFAKIYDTECAADTSATFAGEQFTSSPVIDKSGKIYALTMNTAYRNPNEYYEIINGGNGGDIISFDSYTLNSTALYENLDIHMSGEISIMSDDQIYLIDSKAKSERGAIRKFATDGSSSPTTSFLHTFTFGYDGDLNPGRFPIGRLLEYGDYLYGTNHVDGSGNQGTIYRIKPNGTDLEVLHTFENGTGYPKGGLTDGEDGFIYGMTTKGDGRIYKIRPDGSDYQVIRSFADYNSVLGKTVFGNLTMVNGILYGMTEGGGQYGNGTIFKITTDGSSYVILRHLSVTDGAHPLGSLTFNPDDQHFYGMTSKGGNNSMGTIFKMSLTPEYTFTKIYDFTQSGGGVPDGDLLLVKTPVLPAETLAKKGSNLGSESLDSGINSPFKVYPNPSKNSFKLNSNYEGVSQIQVVNLNGKLVYKNKVDPGQAIEFGEDFISGLYVIKLTQGGETHTMRIVKMEN